MSRLAGHSRPLLLLVLSALLSEAVYLSFSLLYPLPVHGAAAGPFDLEQLSRNRPWAAGVYVLGLLALFATFWVALRIVGQGRSTRRLVVVAGLLFAVTLIWLYPVTATDLFQYVLRARVRVVHGANPMTVPPSAFPADPLLPFAGEWADTLSPYGPAWELLAEGIAWLGPRDAVGGALAYKGLALLAYAACLALVGWGTGGDTRAMLFVAWNPLVLLEGLGNGHNDLLMLAWALLALVVWERTGRWVPAVAALTLAVLTKVAAVLLAPLLLVAVLRDRPTWRQRIGLLLGAGLLAVVIALLAYLPFWPPWESLAGVVDELSHRYTYTIAALLRLALREFVSPPVARAVPRAAGMVVFVLMVLRASVQLARRKTSLPEAAFLVTFTFLFTSTSYRIWYPLWLVPLAAMHLRWRTELRTLLFCLTSELSILMYYLVWRWVLNGQTLPRADWLLMHAITVPWQVGLPLLLPLLVRDSPPHEIRRLSTARSSR